MAGSVIDPSGVEIQPTHTAPLTFDGALGKLALGAGVFCAIFFLAGELFLRKELTPRVVVALYPHLSLQRGAARVMRPEIADIHTRVLALCRANNMACVDLSTALTKFEDSRSIKVSPFDDHPSAEVHRVMAEALYEIFRGGTVKVLS